MCIVWWNEIRLWNHNNFLLCAPNNVLHWVVVHVIESYWPGSQQHCLSFDGLCQIGVIWPAILVGMRLGAFQGGVVGGLSFELASCSRSSDLLASCCLEDLYLADICGFFVLLRFIFTWGIHSERWPLLWRCRFSVVDFHLPSNLFWHHIGRPSREFIFVQMFVIALLINLWWGELQDRYRWCHLLRTSLWWPLSSYRTSSSASSDQFNMHLSKVCSVNSSSAEYAIICEALDWNCCK